MSRRLTGKSAAAAVAIASTVFVASIAAPALGGPDAFSAASVKATAQKALKIAKRADKTARKKAARGPQGPIGPAGAPGQAGPAGQPGKPGQPGISTAITRGTIDTSVIVATTAVQSLALPAGNWVVFAHVDGAHNGTAASTRMECALTAPGGAQLDYAKMRAQANTGAEPMVFVSLSLHGATTLTAPGTVRTNCGSTNGSSFTLTTARMTAIQVGSIVTQ
jgi:hypothetical protein